MNHHRGAYGKGPLVVPIGELSKNFRVLTHGEVAALPDNRGEATGPIREACTNFREVGTRIAGWLGGQPAVGEESITDWMLFELSERLPWVRYRKFNRHEESKDSGADWEWWFVSNHAALGFRIQAKKVVAGSDHYRGLAHTNRRGLQIELLIEAARNDNLLPFYALYHHPVAPVQAMCGGGMHRLGAEGVFVAHAGALYDKFLKGGRANVPSDGLLLLSNPLSCFFCCPLAHRSDPVEGIYHQITHYFGESIQQLANSNVPRPGWRERTPEYIASLLNAGRGAEPEWWEREFTQSLRNTNALLIFDLREG